MKDKEKIVLKCSKKEDDWVLKYNEPKELLLDSIEKEYFVRVHKNNQQEFTFLIETPDRVIRDFVFCRINKKEYLDFVEQLKKFAND